MQRVHLGPMSMASYRGVAPDDILDEVAEAARPLAGVRVLHVSATPYGGGVAEMLRSLVPLSNDLGVPSEWMIFTGDDEFFAATKTLHNALQGAPVTLTAAQRDLYRQTAERNAATLVHDYDVVVVHDPQPAALLAAAGKGQARWVWRCHIDTSAPNPDAWAFLAEFLDPYDAAVFSLAPFVPAGLPIDEVAIIAPAIDPLSPKNYPLADDFARQVLVWAGVDPTRPLVTQVSRFDPWKDPLGVIAAYRRARQAVPGLQLALVGSMALDDPEALEVRHRLNEAVDDDPDIFIFTNLSGVGNVEVNAFQRLSEVVVQKSLREGFGLVVAEALWKATPVVAGRAGGIPQQLEAGGGVLVDDVAGCAQGIVDLLADPAWARELAVAGREQVRQRFLVPRLLLDWGRLVERLGGGTPAEAPAADG